MLPPLLLPYHPRLAPLPDSAAVVAQVAAIYRGRPQLLADLVHDIWPHAPFHEVVAVWNALRSCWMRLRSATAPSAAAEG